MRYGVKISEKLCLYIALCQKFSSQEGEGEKEIGKHAPTKCSVMPLLKCNPASYPSKDEPLSATLSTSSPLLVPSMPLPTRRPPFCFSFYSLNNRTAASGRLRGVTSKRPFRKMQMRVPLSRPRHHPRRLPRLQ